MSTGTGLPTTSFSMPLHNVSDDIGNGELHSHEPVIQKIEVPEAPQIGIIDDDCSDDGEGIVVEMQITRVVNDEEFDVAVQNELKVVKQLWAEMTESEKLRLFRRVRKKRNKQNVRSASQTYNARSKGPPSHMSL
ncbi:hypothetical protein L195_g007364 [Trifolium pratense]|uniref:Uncharacterized protein n=1 Tax=Trifolium pratense TaxID=57577 RepID=A0A2K3P664_TRIPR|nr:hypothetical protein L195_g007364 [Trifolium pratense]